MLCGLVAFHVYPRFLDTYNINAAPESFFQEDGLLLAFFLYVALQYCDRTVYLLCDIVSLYHDAWGLLRVDSVPLTASGDSLVPGCPSTLSSPGVASWRWFPGRLSVVSRPLRHAGLSAG